MPLAYLKNVTTLAFDAEACTGCGRHSAGFLNKLDP